MSVVEEVRFTAASSLPITVWLDDGDMPIDVIDALALSPFTLGDQPWAMTAALDRVRGRAPLMPAEARLLRVSRDREGPESRLACGDGWTLRVVRRRDRTAVVTVTAASEELAKRVLEKTIRGATEPPPKTDHVDMGFWWRGANNARRSQKPITSAPWQDIRHNYSHAARTELERVMAITPDQRMGRLLLLHGPPGTGKTTLLRTLAREWNSWCQTDCVLDPEHLFAEPGYLMEVAVGYEGTTRGKKNRWRLLVLEDCDELIHEGAKQATGQGLSRLLNLTDGMLGQGRDVLVAITTNEDLSRLHPAVTRPGRCLAQIEVGRLSREEAVTWLATSQDAAGQDAAGQDAPDEDSAHSMPSDAVPASRAAAEPALRVPASGATLAELYALRSGQVESPAAEADGTGLYL